MTLLQLIKRFSGEFSYTVSRRAMTTSSKTNKTNHEALSEAVDFEDWELVKSIINLPEYSKPLEGVIYCMSSYTSLDFDDITLFLDCYREGKIS